ncbi:MAG: iron ABC transporter permease [Alphaproteobacteria bacterium]|nr:iron ABC transporter permease [Alphaproteobacteria bacterium]
MAVAIEAGRAAAEATPGRFARRWGGTLWTGALLVVLTFLVAYPVAMLLLGALTKTNPIVDGFGKFDLSIANFAAVMASPGVQAATLNTLVICSLGTLVALVIGVGFAWIVARTNTPCKRLIESAGIMPLFVPPLVGAVAWSILGSPKTGLFNTFLKQMGFDFRIDLYSMTGVVLVFGMYYAPYVYMFVVSTLKNMDPSLEEAAEVSGAGPLRTMLTITFPLIAPAILSSMLLTFIVMLGIYGIPAVLGTPAKISVLTTYIFALTSWSPPLFNTAAAVAILLIAVTAVCVWLQQRVLSRRSYVTVTGKSFKPKQLDLGVWRWLTLSLAVIYLFVVVVLPCAALLIASFRRYMFVPNLASLFDTKQYGLIHFERLLGTDIVWRSIWNTLEVGVLTALIGGALAFAIGYTVTRTLLPGRRLLDMLSTAPVAIPGLVIGVAYLWAWIGLPGGLWGTTLILALALVARFLPDTVKVLSGSLMQIHKELEEASRICGRGTLQTVLRIVLPIARPGVVAAMTLLFILAIRELGSSLFLFTNDTIVMAVLLLDLYEGGNAGATAAFSVVQSVILLLVLGASSLLSRTVSGVVARS